MHITSDLSALLGMQGGSSAQGASNLLTRKTGNADASSASTSQSADDGLDDSDETGATDAEKAFLDYMKKPVAQRLRDAWLSSHNLTEKDLAAMSAADREAIEKQMAADLKSQMQQQAQAKATATSGTAPGLAKLLSASL